MDPIIRSVMYFVDAPERVATWWATAMNRGVRSDGEFWYLELGELEIGFHPSVDGRNPPGSSTVAYFATHNLDRDLSRFKELGCTVHRGPLTISPTRVIAQLSDPFGNIFGLDGPATTTS